MSRREPSIFDRFAALTSDRPVLMMTAGFGRSSVRDAAYRLRSRHRDFDFKLSWQLFGALVDWGERWPTEQNNFTAGLILSRSGNPMVERAVGRCLADLCRLGRPLLWGVVSDRIRWHPRFKIAWAGWPVALHPPPTTTYARLCVADDAGEFCPQFDPILYTAEPDFFISNSRLLWRFNELWDCGLGALDAWPT